MSTLREQIVAEAYTWIGTPYVHLGGIKGVGVDCAMILVRIAQAVGICPPEYDPRPYPIDWYLHRGDELYIAQLLPWAHRVETPLPGDIALYRIGRAASHGAVIVSDEMLIHAERRTRQVGLMERRAMDHCLDSYWSVAA